MMSRRAAYVVVTVTTIAVGLAVFLRGAMLPNAVRDVSADALWAFMVASMISAVAPHVLLRNRCLIALGVAYAVEFSQMIRIAWLDKLRSTLPGHLVLGQGFDARDLVAYLLGVITFAAIGETIAARMSAARR